MSNPKFPRAYLTKEGTEFLRRVADALGTDNLYPLPKEAKGYGMFQQHTERWLIGKMLGDLLDEVTVLRAALQRVSIRGESAEEALYRAINGGESMM